ncbi:anti-sigma factor [Streptomyces sp. CAU 1734]|uniref:anti-sigma factor n=1 Tax=Streptomyces sp. CAU 1734 TaxID=3140360 RepID=UPI003260525D
MAEHLDPRTIAELALRHTPLRDPVPLLGHLAECAVCRRELDELRRVTRMARETGTADLPSAPPDHLWPAIAAQLGFGGPAPAPPPGSCPPPARAPGRRRTRLTRPAAVLAAGCLLLGAVSGAAAGRWWPAPDPRPAPAAAAPPVAALAPLGGARAAGTAQLQRRPGGERGVRIRVSALPATRGYFAVWLMDRPARRMIALGVLGRSGSATLPVPEGVDLSAHPVIDVSVQAYNGDPAHSGRSVVRGALAK